MIVMHSTASMANTSLARRIVEGLTHEAVIATVAEVRIGLGYTAVKLEDGRAGVAYTFRDQAKGGCSVFHGLRPLAGRVAVDLLPLLQSSDAIEAAVGLACANALANSHDDSMKLEGDILDHLDAGPDDDVAMVGYFGPLVPKLQKSARSLTVFERVTTQTSYIHPQEEALTILPKCQIALITATSIINHTIDELLVAARGCRQVAILGASTPLWTDAFAGTGVTMLSGVVVTSPDGILRVVSEGGGMQQFSPHVRKVTMKVL